ncbi:MAG TPA: EsaB/YukD family protein [Thermoleophilaceae bacterium]|jgi:MinD-like ATPase involved in chromosome partitioning or flagellar assembly
MNTLVVTISGPERRVDLAVPAETPIEQLLPTFMSLGVIDEKAVNGHPLSLSRAGEPPLPPASTLAECGVVDGTLLQLQPIQPEERPEPPPERVAYEQFEAEQDEADLKRRAGFPLHRTRLALPDAPTLGERMSAAMNAFFSSEAPEPAAEPTPPPDDAEAAPVARPIDLTVRHAPSRRDRARAAWRSTSYMRRLDDMILAPRLRRCATVAVVSPKGGVGKTTTTALLGSLLARVRHEKMVAVDTNPDYGSLGRALTPDHRVFVDDLVDLLDHPDLTVAELDRKLGRAFDGLLVLPAPTDPSRMARLDKAAYAKVFGRLKTMAGGLVLDCGTGLQEPAAQAAIEAADQIVLVSDSEPSTASLVAEAAQLLKRAGPPMFLIVNKLPRRGGRLDLEMFSRAVPDARAMITVAAEPVAASALAAGDFSWDDAPKAWQQSIRELGAVMVADWPGLGLAT